LKTCNKCHKAGLEWDKDFHEKTGKWRLQDDRGKPHHCGKQENGLKLSAPYKTPLEKICNKCGTKSLIIRKEGLDLICMECLHNDAVMMNVTS